MSTTTATATETMAELIANRERASARVDTLEREAAQAGRELAEARAALVQAEREGVTAAQLREREKQLADAEAATRRLPLRVEGARQALADAHAAVQKHAAGHTRELVQPLERDGEIAAADVLALAQQLLDAIARREAVAGAIGQTASLGHRLDPGSVGPPSNAHDVSRACQTLLMAGEPAPRLRSYPGEDRGAIVDEAVPA